MGKLKPLPSQIGPLPEPLRPSPPSHLRQSASCIERSPVDLPLTPELAADLDQLLTRGKALGLHAESFTTDDLFADLLRQARSQDTR